VQPEHVAADLAEAVDVFLAGRAPVDELDAELEGRLALADHLQLIDASEGEKIADVGNRGFADADGADLLGFDQLDLDLAQPLREHGSGRPAGGAAADDRHFSYRLIGSRQHSLPGSTRV